MRFIRCTKHMSQNIFRVLQSLSHFLIATLQSLSQRISQPLPSFIHISHHPILTRKYNLRPILKIHLYNFIRQPKHNSMSRSHPFLHIMIRKVFSLLNRVRRFTFPFQIRPKMLQQSHFFLQFFRVLSKHIRLD